MTNQEQTMDTQNDGGRQAARVRRAMVSAVMAALVAVAGVTWLSPRTAAAGPRALPGATAAATAPAASGAAADDDRPARTGKKDVSGKLNLNTATVDQLMLLPGVGPSKAERVVAWRGKYGPFKRVADLRKVKGFGYKTLKKLEPFLDIKGDSTLQAR